MLRDADLMTMGHHGDALFNELIKQATRYVKEESYLHGADITPYPTDRKVDITAHINSETDVIMSIESYFLDGDCQPCITWSITDDMGTLLREVTPYGLINEWNIKPLVAGALMYAFWDLETCVYFARDNRIDELLPFIDDICSMYSPFNY